jgi:2-keto-4-pentenoate hydratase
VSRVAEIAALLRVAAEQRRPIPPPSQTHPGLTLDDAYAVQLAQVEGWTGAGRVSSGHKVV